MAEIGIQEKRGSPWIWLLLGAVVLAVIVWFFLGALDGPDGEVVLDADPIPVLEEEEIVVEPTAPAMITDLSQLLGPSVPVEMEGSAVQLQGVPVMRAVSDQAFWAGNDTTPDQGLFVIRGNQMASYTAPDGAVDDGDQVNVWGTVATMPTDLTQAATEWNIESTDRSLLTTENVYVLADSVRISDM